MPKFNPNARYLLCRNCNKRIINIDYIKTKQGNYCNQYCFNKYNESRLHNYELLIKCSKYRSKYS
jgi:hypothetical protein